jgi:hypothetical protein
MKNKYDRQFTKEQLIKEYETQSVCTIAKKFKIPMYSLYKIFERLGIKRRLSNAGGFFSPGFKHGKCSSFLPKYCSCGKRLSNNPKAIRCSHCSNLYAWKNKEIRNKRINGIKNKYHIDPTYRLNRSGRKSSSFGKIRHGKGTYYNNIWMRSSYEIKFAKWLDEHFVPWKYESKTFDLGNTTYTPDFYLPEINLYIEIKGWWRDDAKKKFDLFLQKYPTNKIKVFNKEKLQSIGVL